MKREELERLGLTKEQIDSVCDLNNKDVQPLKDDLQKAQDDLKVAQDKVTTTEEALKKFDGVDPEKLNQQISDLQNELKQKDSEHAKALADRDFEDLIKEAIGEAKGRNTKAIRALLDVDALKASKNQKNDVAAALKKLAEAEDSKMLFGEPEPKPTGKVDPIGRVDKPAPGQKESLRDALKEHYKQ